MCHDLGAQVYEMVTELGRQMCTEKGDMVSEVGKECILDLPYQAFALKYRGMMPCFC